MQAAGADNPNGRSLVFSFASAQVGVPNNWTKVFDSDKEVVKEKGSNELLLLPQASDDSAQTPHQHRCAMLLQVISAEVDTDEPWLQFGLADNLYIAG